MNAHWWLPRTGGGCRRCGRPWRDRTHWLGDEPQMRPSLGHHLAVQATAATRAEWRYAVLGATLGVLVTVPICVWAWL